MQQWWRLMARSMTTSHDCFENESNRLPWSCSNQLSSFPPRTALIDVKLASTPSALGPLSGHCFAKKFNKREKKRERLVQMISQSKNGTQRLEGRSDEVCCWVMTTAAGEQLLSQGFGSGGKFLERVREKWRRWKFKQEVKAVSDKQTAGVVALTLWSQGEQDPGGASVSPVHRAGLG